MEIGFRFRLLTGILCLANSQGQQKAVTCEGEMKSRLVIFAVIVAESLSGLSLVVYPPWVPRISVGQVVCYVSRNLVA